VAQTRVRVPKDLLNSSRLAVGDSLTASRRSPSPPTTFYISLSVSSPGSAYLSCGTTRQEQDVGKPEVEQYTHPAGGWGALAATGRALIVQKTFARGAMTLLQMNQPMGFDCPGCAWPEPKRGEPFQFCENGAKALAWEATAKRCTPEFLAAHTVSELSRWDDYDLEMVGRLTHPMRYDIGTDRYVPVEWAEALAQIGTLLRGIDDSNQVEFYTSGR